MKLLLADDEPDMIRALSAILTHEGYKVDAVCDGAEALEKAAAVSYDGLILDIMMPKLDGLAVLSALRDKDILTPVLLLTAKSQTEDKISGLDCGADDYMTKPFDAGELLARIRALTRRQGEVVGEALTTADLTLDLSGYYQSAAIQGTYDVAPSWSVNAGVKWTFDKSRASLSVRCNDIFESSLPFAKVRYKGQYLDMDSGTYTRSVTVHFSYRFGTYKEKRHKTVDTSRFGH